MTPAERLLTELTGLPDREISARLAQEYPAWIVWHYPPGPWWAMRKTALHSPSQATVRAYTLARLIQRIAEREQA